jgi:5'-nucleotidase
MRRAKRWRLDILRKLLTLDLPSRNAAQHQFSQPGAKRCRRCSGDRAKVGAMSTFMTIDKRMDGRGNAYYWLAYAGQNPRPDAGTDLETVRAGYVSITPLSVDMTDHASRDAVAERSWTQMGQGL